VIKGERNLTGPVLVNLAQAMGFDRPQTGHYPVPAEVAGQAWDNFPENAIAMQTATLGLSAEAAQTAMAEMKAFLKRLPALAQADALPVERVYQVNPNFFPVSKTVEGHQP
jgi:hypothetical protein